MDGVGVAAQEIADAAILLVIAPVVRQSVVPPVVTPALGGDKLSIRCGNEADKFTVVGSGSAADADALRPNIHHGHPDPGGIQVETGVVEAQLARELVALNADHAERRVVHESSIGQGEQETDEP